LNKELLKWLEKDKGNKFYTVYDHVAEVLILRFMWDTEKNNLSYEVILPREKIYQDNYDVVSAKIEQTIADIEKSKTDD